MQLPAFHSCHCLDFVHFLPCRIWVDHNCQTPGGYFDNEVCTVQCTPRARYSRQLASEGWYRSQRGDGVWYNEFHSVIVLASCNKRQLKLSWELEAQQGAKDDLLYQTEIHHSRYLVGRLTGLSHRTIPRRLIGTATCSVLCHVTVKLSYSLCETLTCGKLKVTSSRVPADRFQAIWR